MNIEAIIELGRALAHGNDHDQAAHRLRHYVLNTDTSFIIKEFNSYLGTQNAVDYLSAVCIATRSGLVSTETPSDIGKCTITRLNLFLQAIKTFSLADPRCSPEQAIALTTALNEYSTYFTGAADLSIIMDAALEAFESDAPLACHALDVLPPILSTLHSMGGDIPGATSINNNTAAFARCDGSANTDASANMFNGVAARICDHSWPPRAIAAILSSLRALPLPVPALIASIKRGAARARSADIIDLPSIAHQLLALAGPACRDTALSEIVNLFDRLEPSITEKEGVHHRATVSRLLEVQGSVLLHLEMAIKHDPTLGKVWLKRLKEGSWRPTPFAFALSLVVAGTEHTEHHVLTTLSAALVKATKDANKRALAPWLPTERNASHMDAQNAMHRALLTCAFNSGRGLGSIVVQPLVNLAVLLLESEIVPKNNFSSNSEDVRASSGQLGIRILVEIFGSHKECRRDVLALCNGRLAAATETSAAPYVRLMYELVEQHSTLVEMHLPEVRGAVENLVTLPPGAAMALLVAMWPLCRARKDVSDFVVMLLRKSMFSRELGARLLAARGFLFIISQELSYGRNNSNSNSTNRDVGPCTFHASQGAGAAPVMSQMNALGGGGAAGSSTSSGACTLLHELMGFLRRCLAQQPEVRTVVYDGIPAVLSADPAASEAIAELLLPHVASFYEYVETMAPLKLEACARLSPDGTEVRISEPVHRLLSCVRIVLSTAHVEDTVNENDDEQYHDLSLSNYHNNIISSDQQSLHALRSLFRRICSRLVSCPLEDFDFDQSTTFSSNDARGVLNQSYAQLLLGCYEVAMEEAVGAIDARPPLDAQHSEALAEELLTLFQQHRRLHSLVTEGMRGTGNAARGRRGEGGLTQAVAGAAGGRGGKNTVLKSTCFGPFPERIPNIGVHCLGRLLESIVDDGLVPGGHTVGGGKTSNHVTLARDVNIQTFIMTACFRILKHFGTVNPTGATFQGLVAAASEKQHHSTQSDEDVAIMSSIQTAEALFGIPNWRHISSILFKTTHLTILACARNQTAPENGGVGKKEKDPMETLMQISVAALEQLVKYSGGDLAVLADLLRHVALPGSNLAAEARLPVVNDADSESHLAIVSARLPLFKQLLDVLVENACAREIPCFVGCLTSLLGCLPPPWAASMASWLDACCTSAPSCLSNYPNAAKLLLSLWLKCHEAAGTGQDTELLCHLAARMQAVMDVDTPGSALQFSASQSTPLLSSKTVSAFIITSATHIDGLLVPLDWVLGRLKACVAAGRTEDGVVEGSDASTTVGALVQGQIRIDWENATFGRLQSMAKAAAALSRVSVNIGTDALPKCLTKLYRTLGTAAKTQIAARGHHQLPPGGAFQQLAEYVNSHLTPATITLKGELQMTNNNAINKESSIIEDGEDGNENDDEENENGNEGPKKARIKRAALMRKVQKDNRLLPGLIFQIEEWEKHLIKVGKASKINLMLTAKRTTAWDFRVIGDSKRQKMVREEGGCENENNEGEREELEEEEENGLPEEMYRNDDGDGMFSSMQEEDGEGFYDQLVD